MVKITWFEPSKPQRQILLTSKDQLRSQQSLTKGCTLPMWISHFSLSVFVTYEASDNIRHMIIKIWYKPLCIVSNKPASRWNSHSAKGPVSNSNHVTGYTGGATASCCWCYLLLQKPENSTTIEITISSSVWSELNSMSPNWGHFKNHLQQVRY